MGYGCKLIWMWNGERFNLHLFDNLGLLAWISVQELEEKRKAKSKVFYERKKQLIQLRLKATKRVEEQISSLQETLVPISYKA